MATLSVTPSPRVNPSPQFRGQGSRRQLGERVQPEQAQEVGGRRQKRWTPAAAKSRVVFNQPASEQRLNHAAAVGPSDMADLGAGDRLLIGDDGQDFQRRL